jgi:hypothetical protein
MKYTVEMGSSAKIRIPSFMKTGSGIQKLIRDMETHTRTRRRPHKRTLGKWANNGEKEEICQILTPGFKICSVLNGVDEHSFQWLTSKRLCDPH